MEYDKLFNSINDKQKKYPLANGYISQTTIFFENEKILANIEAKGNIEFLNEEGGLLSSINIPKQTGGKEVYDEVLCHVDGNEVILTFFIVKWIDNYPHCDGEHDRWDSVVIGSHTVKYNIQTKNITLNIDDRR